jgi:hypothetical protein
MSTSSPVIPSASEINYHSSVCHWMPCSIDYDGLAPVSMYFNPEEAIISQQQQQQQQQHENEHDFTQEQEGNKKQQHERQDQNQPKNSQYDKDIDSSRKTKKRRIHAAAFRGRGLLAPEIQDLYPQKLKGVVYLPPPSSIHTNTGMTDHNDQVCLRIGETFTQVMEWEHEWDVKKIVSKCNDNDAHSKNLTTMERSFELMELLRQVHDPIEIEQQYQEDQDK